MSDLKPCPFCGGKATMQAPNMHRKTCIACKECGMSTGWGAVEEVTAAWNRRAQPANEPLTLEELSEMSDTDWVWVMFPELAPEESGWHRAKRLYDTYSKSHYSKTWLAYHRQPERSENK